MKRLMLGYVVLFHFLLKYIYFYTVTRVLCVFMAFKLKILALDNY